MAFDPSQAFEIETEDESAPQAGAFDPSAPFEVQPGAWRGQLNTARRAIKQLQQLDAASHVMRGARPEGGYDRAAAQATIDQLRERLPAAAQNPRLKAWIERQIQAREAAMEQRSTAARADVARSVEQGAARLTELQQQIDAIPESADVEDYNRAEGWDAFVQMLRNPVEVPTNIMVRGAVSSVPAMVAGTAGGAAAGPVGAAAGVGAGSYLTEYIGAVTETLAERKVSLDDAAAVMAAVQDPEFVKAARERGVARGVPIAAFDALSAGIAGRFLRGARASGSGMAKAALKEAGTQAVAGGAGEATAQVAAGDKFDPKAIWEEVIGEVVPGTREVVQGARMDRREAVARGEQIAAEAEPARAREAAAAPIAPTPSAPAEAPEAGSLADVLAGVEKDQAAADREAQQAEAERQARLDEVQQRRLFFPKLVATIDDVLQTGEQSEPARVSGLARQAETYAEDNSLGFSRDMREQLLSRARALRELEQRQAPAAEAAAQQRAEQLRAQQQREAADTKARIAAERRTVREARAQGIGPDGTIDYQDAPTPALERLAEQGDERAQQALMRREEGGQIETDEDAAADDLLTVLRRVQLPRQDTGSLDSDLQNLIGEEMNFGMRQALVKNKPGSLDDLATSLREDHGFTQIRTPDDVLSLAREALRGRRVMPAAQVDMAQPGAQGSLSRTPNGYAPGVLEKTVEPREPNLTRRDALGELRRAFPELHREFMVDIGAVQSILAREGFRGNVPEGVEAAIFHERKVIALAVETWMNRKSGAWRLMHELGHAYWRALPESAKEILREQQRREVEAATQLARTDLSRRERQRLAREAGPLFDDQGRRTSGAAYVAELDERGVQEWFAERIAALNAQWAAGRMQAPVRSQAQSLLEAAARALRELFERIGRAFAQKQGSDWESDFWQGEFQNFLNEGATARRVQPTGRAFRRAERDRDANLRARLNRQRQQAGLPPLPEPVAASRPEERVQGSQADFSTPDTPADAELTAAQARLRDAREAVEMADERATDLRKQIDATEDRTEQREMMRQLEQATKERERLYREFTAARDARDAAEDRIRLREAGKRTLEQRRTEDPREAAVGDYEQLGRDLEAAGKAGNWAQVEILRARREEMRADLNRRFPGWNRGRAAETETMPEGSPVERQPGEDETLPPAQREFAVDTQKRLDVEGHAFTQESALARTWASVKSRLRDFAGAIPELPTFPTAFWNKQDKFLQGNPEYYNRVKEGLRALRRATPAVYKDAEQMVAAVTRGLLAARKGRTFPAKAYARLAELQQQARKLAERGAPEPEAMRREKAALLTETERDPYVLFTRLVMYLDMEWRATHLFDDQGQPITLPGNLNLAEVQARLKDLRAKAEAHPAAREIARALQGHARLVAEMAADLQQRELLPGDHLRNPWYFPHLVVDKTTGRLEAVQVDTAQDFRGYLFTPVGSAKPIETDYVRAMYYHTVQVLAHNRRADIVENYFREPYDIRAEVQKRAQALARQWGRPVSWREAFFREYADKGYVLYGADDGPTFVPALNLDRGKLAQILGHQLTAEPVAKQLAELGIKGVNLRAEDIQDALMAGEREYWVLPEKVAEALRGIIRRDQAKPGAWSKFFSRLQGLWKSNILFAPWNYPRYEFNNTVADLEKLFSADPAMAKKLPQAFREVRALWTGDGTITPEVREAFKLGVLDSVTAREIGMLPDLREFETLATQRQKLWNFLRKHNTVAVSRYREATFRYAKFLADLERIRAGARPVYAGAYWRDVEAIQDSAKGAGDRAARQAAEISLKTFGDYNDISVNGDTMRRLLVPFYSWMEINFRYHANLFRNLRDALVAHDRAMAATSAAAAGRAAAVAGFTLTRKAAAMFLVRLALPYLAVMAWNNSGDREEIEEELSEEDKRRFHIVLGRDEQGRARVIYTPTALSDVMRWFSGPEAARLAVEVFKGRTDAATAFGEWADRLVPDFLNNTLGSMGPLYKVPVMAATGKTFFPDVTEPRTIPAYDMRRALLANMTDQFVADVIERVVNKDYVSPRDTGDWIQQLVLQVRRRDADEWAFYAIRDKANDFIEERTGTKRSMDYDAPDQQVLRNFRRAIYRGDAETALRMYDRLLELGYTSDRFTASLRAQDPLSILGKKGEDGNLRQQFVDSLDPYERAQLERAYQHYGKMSAMKGEEKRLFPRKGKTPQQAEIFRRNFTPRPDIIIDELQDLQQMDPAERQRMIERDLANSLRVRR